MADLLAPVDAETLAVAYLETVDDLVDLVGEDGISTKLPRSWVAGDRHVRITRIGGFPADAVGHLDRARLQVDAFGTDGADAHDLAAQVLVAFRRLAASTFTYPGAVVTGMVQDLGLSASPDRDTDAPRYLFGVVLYIHPVPIVEPPGS